MHRLELATSPSHLPRPAGEDRLDAAIEKASIYLRSLQHEDGYWLGELEADTTLESDYIFYLHVLDRFEPKRVAKLAEYIRRRQLHDGGWNIYGGGPSEVNATVKAYFALKLAGDEPESPHMARACRRARELGGLEHTNSFTRFYLAMGGVVDWEMVPAVPPELMFLPRWFPINIYEMSSWTRAIVIPLTILYARKPRWEVPVTLDELFTREPASSARGFNWRRFFLTLDQALKVYDRLPSKPGRGRAVRRARAWMMQHFDRSEGLAAIYPAMMNSIFALMALGLIVLRRHADFRPVFRAPLGPVLPIAFAMAALLVALNQIAAAPLDSLTGLVLVLIGWPVFLLWSRRNATRGELVV